MTRWPQHQDACARISHSRSFTVTINATKIKGITNRTINYGIFEQRKPYINECKQITVINYNVDESQKHNVEFKKTQEYILFDSICLK